MWAVATVILVIGMVDDLRSRKIHNGLLLSLLPFVLGLRFYFQGGSGLGVGAIAFALALFIAIPLFATGAIGGGDVKLFSVFALAVDPTSVFWTLVYSFVWGAQFGVTRAVLQKQILAVVRNTYRLGQRQKISPTELHRIPYSFALLLGWFTQVTFLRIGGVL